MNGKSLLQDWVDQRDRALADPALAFRWAKRSNSNGEYLLAIEITERFLGNKTEQIDPKIRLSFQQQLALAFARSGFTDKAKGVLEQLHVSGATDAETLGLLGSVYKALSSKAAAADEKLSLLKTSRDFYRLGFQGIRDPYCGINAATLSIMLDELDTAKSLAEDTLAAVPQNNDYWDLATAAEANLILGRLDEAREIYTRASAAAGERWADIFSTRKQCRQLCFKLQGRRELLDGCFPSGVVGFFAGHMLDAPDRATPRFPPTAVPGVEERIKNWLTSTRIRFSFSSAGSGGDILFLEMAQGLNIETHILLPFSKEPFVQTSVLPAGPDWVKRFETVMGNAASITVLNDGLPDFHASSYDFTNQMICARAAARAKVDDSPLMGLALWNGQLGDSQDVTGDTATAVMYWARGKVPIQVIHPTNLKLDGIYDLDQPPLERPFSRIYTADPKGIRTEVATMLFLRIKGYEAFREEDFEHFFQDLLGGLSEALAQNGWFPARHGFAGEYLFVWEMVRDAGLAAITFMALLQAGKPRWPESIDFSLCLHTAPVQLMVNPILNQYTHEGAAVSKLEALSGRLPPGIVYATETFANLTAFEKIRDFNCEYSGTIAADADLSETRIYQVSK
jgi:adenylate cyclase